MFRRLLLAVVLLTILPAAVAVAQDTLAVADTLPPRKAPFLKRLNSKVDKVLRSFNKRDSNYIEPQHYDFAAMAQHTQIYQYTLLRLDKGHTLSLSPDVVFKLGPYFGWKWVFLGYTVDVKNFMKNTSGTYLDFSLYSNQIGVDLYYMDNGSSFKIRHMKMGSDLDTSPLDGTYMEGLSVRSKGFNIYYITNHHKFSYPAAFSQSTQQKRSAASALLGFGYAHHSIDIDFMRFMNQLSENIPHFEETIENADPEYLDKIFSNATSISEVDYHAYTLSAGWGYNWVFARNCLLAISLQPGLSYNVTSTEYEEGFRHVMRHLSLSNVSIDLTGRLGLVYNNARWFSGLSAIVHNYNYHTDAYRAYNFYGSINIYAGINFDINMKKRRR